MTREILEQQMSEAVKAFTVKATEVSYRDADITINGCGDDAFLSVFFPYSMNVPTPIRNIVHTNKYESLEDVMAAVDKVIADSKTFDEVVKEATQTVLAKMGYNV